MIKTKDIKESYGKLLGPLEQEILEFLWKKGEGSGKEVFSGIRASREIALTTVLTVLERLANKGLVEKERGASVFVYRPAYTRDAFARAVSQEVLKGIFEISSSGACASFVDALAETDATELERLSELIESKKKELAKRG